MPSPSAKSASRYLLKGIFIGVAVGVLAGHPLFMVAHHLHEHFGHQAPLAVAKTIWDTYSLHAWPLTLFFALTGGLLGAAWGRLHHRHQVLRLNYQARLRALAAEMSVAEEQERRRLATELHEEVGQILAITQVKLGQLTANAESPMETSTLKEVRGYVDKSIKYIRTLAGELSPPVLYELGFGAAVDWQARQTQDQYGVKVEVIQHPPGWPPCNDGQILLFVVVRDLLTYVARQTQAHGIKIFMEQEGDYLHLRVEHDGRVISDPGCDFALFSIRERLDRIGGELDAQVSPGRGPAFILKAPLCYTGSLTPPLSETK
jgi:signal transduction histidine kinase